ncbi:helix-turn-helix domain-containing protein [Streptomyces sp. NPDC093097]|uniref:helix-turn-helix domain-containing protein n=1 Tax=Streptomyces sp. NPDC093097 TaxID=3366027 RepID=UPI003802B3B1
MITASRIRPDLPYYSLATHTPHTLDAARDIDLIAVERTLNDDAPETLTPLERWEAARLLTARGVGPAETARRTGVSRTQVDSWKRRGWRPPNQPSSD